MKNNIIYILIILTFIVSLGFYKGIWQKVESYDEDSINLFLDTDSIRTRGDFVYYRTRTNYNEQDFVCWVKSDCKNNLTSVLGCRNYSKKVETDFYNYIDSDEMQSFTGSSAMLSYHKKACQLKRNTPKEKTINWNPYMRNLEKDIKANWNPPKSDKTTGIVAKFYIEKDGSLKDLKLIKYSKNKELNTSAIDAIKKTAPFRPLPKEFKGESVPVEFSFDYNVINKE